jgi:hypothetical protein
MEEVRTEPILLELQEEMVALVVVQADTMITQEHFLAELEFLGKDMLGEIVLVHMGLQVAAVLVV